MNKKKNIVVGTRASLLAMTQTQQTCKMIFSDQSSFILKKIITAGDLEQKKTFSEFGRQALFTRELDEALLGYECDVAIHSFKDLTGDLKKGLKIAMLCNEVDEKDSFVSKKYKAISDMPEGAIIGTSSVRRYAILKKYYPHLKVKPIRGNIDTRVSKMEKGEYDAIILAKAGLIRLNKLDSMVNELDSDIFTPPLGQGLIAVVTRDSDDVTKQLNMNKNIFYYKDMIFLKNLVSSYEGGCSLPFGLHIEAIDQNKLQLKVYLGNAVNNQESRFHLIYEQGNLEQLKDGFTRKMYEHGAQDICNQMKGFQIPYE